jgi:hypothetical protein
MPQALIDSGIADIGCAAADLGTLKHDYAEQVFLGIHDPKVIPGEFELLATPEEEWQEVKTAVNAVKTILKDVSDQAVIRTEARVAMDGWRSDCFGTADILVYDPVGKIGYLYILDYKFGRVAVSPFTSQLRIYGIAAIETLEKEFPDIRKNLHMVTMGIIQPKISGVYATHTVPLNMLLEWDKEVLQPKQREIVENRGVFNPGPHCGDKYCKLAKHNSCPAVINQVDELMEMFVDTTTNKPKMIPNESNWGMFLKLMKHEQTINKVIASAWKVAEEKAKNGEKVDGFKLVRAKTNRKWADEEKAKKFMNRKLPKAELYKEVFITGPQAETKLKKEGKLERIEDDFYALIEKPVGALILVPESDGRKEELFIDVDGTIEEIFDIAPPKEEGENEEGKGKTTDEKEEYTDDDITALLDQLS